MRYCGCPWSSELRVGGRWEWAEATGLGSRDRGPRCLPTEGHPAKRKRQVALGLEAWGHTPQASHSGSSTHPRAHLHFRPQTMWGHGVLAVSHLLQAQNLPHLIFETKWQSEGVPVVQISVAPGFGCHTDTAVSTSHHLSKSITWGLGKPRVLYHIQSRLRKLQEGS